MLYGTFTFPCCGFTLSSVWLPQWEVMQDSKMNSMELYRTIFSISVHVSLKKSWSSCFCGLINYLMLLIVLYSFLHTQALAIIELLQEENKFYAIYGFFKINNALLLITAYPDNNANTKSLVLMIFPFAWAFWFLLAMMRVFS